MRITMQMLAAAKADEYQRGLAEGKKWAAVKEDESLKKRTQDLMIRVMHLEGACLVAKSLYEHLRLVGVPDWVTRR